MTTTRQRSKSNTQAELQALAESHRRVDAIEAVLDKLTPDERFLIMWSLIRDNLKTRPHLEAADRKGSRSAFERR
ncbi:MAG TPA: hypothetical protein VK540_26755 [Polyangiaceae bacterium]|nr:hypothetical protein [Polyangiaceae bacterium]